MKIKLLTLLSLEDDLHRATQTHGPLSVHISTKAKKSGVQYRCRVSSRRENWHGWSLNSLSEAVSNAMGAMRGEEHPPPC